MAGQKLVFLLAGGAKAGCCLWEAEEAWLMCRQGWSVGGVGWWPTGVSVQLTGPGQSRVGGGLRLRLALPDLGLMGLVVQAEQWSSGSGICLGMDAEA